MTVPLTLTVPDTVGGADVEDVTDAVTLQDADNVNVTEAEVDTVTVYVAVKLSEADGDPVKVAESDKLLERVDEGVAVTVVVSLFESVGETEALTVTEAEVVSVVVMDILAVRVRDGDGVGVVETVLDSDTVEVSVLVQLGVTDKLEVVVKEIVTLTDIDAVTLGAAVSDAVGVIVLVTDDEDVGETVNVPVADGEAVIVSMSVGVIVHVYE